MLRLDDLSTAALYYAELGYAVFPCIPGTKTPLTRNGFKDATTDLDLVESWWQKYPNANIATPTEHLLVIDVDGANNPWLAGDEKQWDLSRASIARTPRGGFHHYFKQPQGKAWRNTTSRLAPHVDTRANGGYVLLPPSFVNGSPYIWQPECELTDPPARLLDPPAWLIELLDSISEEKLTAHSTAGNEIPIRQRNMSLARLAGVMRRAGMTEPEIRAALLQTNTDRCAPPLETREVEKIASSIARYEPDQVTVAFVEDHFSQDRETKRDSIFRGAFEMCQELKEMNPPLIHGLLREGETMNVIAAPKAGKSWLVLNLAFSVCSGRRWLDFDTVPGRVLLIDNELHPETLANRIPRVAEALKLRDCDWKDHFFVEPLRGRLRDLNSMENYFKSLPPNYFKLIILDAFYRFMPSGMDENDNGAMANLFNLIDRCAGALHSGFVLVHHTTKGVQSGKSVTDVGAGAGSQSRAADCHLVLRPHEIDDCLSVHAVTRSWPSPKPFVIRQTFPLWIPDPRLDPEALKKPDQYHRQPKTSSATPVDEIEWTAEKFVSEFITDAPQCKALIIENAEQADLSTRRTARFLQIAEEQGLIYRWQIGRHKALGYATTAPPAESNSDPDLPLRQRVENYIAQNSHRSSSVIANELGVDNSYVRRIRREMKGESND